MSSAWHNKCFSLPLGKFQWNVSVALRLNSSPSCFLLHRLSAKKCLSHTLSQEFQFFPSEGHFLFFCRLLSFAFEAQEDSLRRFVCEIARAIFLFHVAETKLYQIILWRIRIIFFSSWKSQVGLPSISGIPRVDGVTKRYVTCVHGTRSQIITFLDL